MVHVAYQIAAGIGIISGISLMWGAYTQHKNGAMDTLTYQKNLKIGGVLIVVGILSASGILPEQTSSTTTGTLPFRLAFMTNPSTTSYPRQTWNQGTEIFVSMKDYHKRKPAQSKEECLQMCKNLPGCKAITFWDKEVMQSDTGYCQPGIDPPFQAFEVTPAQYPQWKPHVTSYLM